MLKCTMPHGTNAKTLSQGVTGNVCSHSYHIHSTKNATFGPVKGRNGNSLLSPPLKVVMKAIYSGKVPSQLKTSCLVITVGLHLQYNLAILTILKLSDHIHSVMMYPFCFFYSYLFLVREKVEKTFRDIKIIQCGQ